MASTEPEPEPEPNQQARAAYEDDFEATHIATPGPSLYTPTVTKTGGGLLGDAPQYTFRGDSQPRSFIETAFLQSSSPGPAYNPTNQTVAKSQAPRFSFGTERRLPSPYGRGRSGPGPNSYRVKGNQHGGGEFGDAPKFSFGTREQSVRPESELDRVPYISSDHERENFGALRSSSLCVRAARMRSTSRCTTGVFSPGPAAYSPRESLHRKVHEPTAPAYTMRPHLKNKVRSDGVTLSWAKGALLRCSMLLEVVGSSCLLTTGRIRVCAAVSGGPGPGASNPRVNKNGGGFIGDAPAHKIGTGIKIPHPALNLKKREFATAARGAVFGNAVGLMWSNGRVGPQSSTMEKVLTAPIRGCFHPVRRRTLLEIATLGGSRSDPRAPLSRSAQPQDRAPQLQVTAKCPVCRLGTTRNAGLQISPLLRPPLRGEIPHKLEHRARAARRIHLK